MKILLSHRFFHPDTAPYAFFLRGIGAQLVRDGHDVHVQSAVPSYRGRQSVARVERIDGMQVYRCGSLAERGASGVVRGLNALRYVGALVWRILRLRPDVVTASTFPPVVAAWAACLAAKAVGARFVYHVQDIHPEASAVIGARLGQGAAERVLRWMDTGTLRRADVVITLSEDMAATLRARGAAIPDLRLFTNPPLEDADTSAVPDAAMRKQPGRVRAIFAGNLGRFQNLPMLAEGVARLFPQHPQLELCFLGDGAMLPVLQERWKNHPQVTFLPHVPVSVARSLLQEADLGLVALQPGMFRVAFPSKVQTYAALGLPIVALVEPESALARSIEANGQGTVAKALTADAVADATERALADRIAPDLRRLPEAPAPFTNWSELMADLETRR
jgi:colanic acid biosynthesis glycosyl transferase WcaI